MDTVSVKAQTREQIERAKRAAEEARERIRAGKSWSPCRVSDGEQQATDDRGRGDFVQYFSGD